jgi:hypothetical protein
VGTPNPLVGGAITILCKMVSSSLNWNPDLPSKFKALRSKSRISRTQKIDRDRMTNKKDGRSRHENIEHQTMELGILMTLMHVPTLKSLEDKLITSLAERTNVFIQYFASVFTVDDGRNPVCNSKTDQNCTISDVEFIPRKMYIALSSLNPKHSYGPDGLPSIMIHNLARVVSEPLLFILDASF